ncbi:hypothetical protein HNQ38_000351 [Desulfovibrio intestinalis]|uniref:Uncharacterized protein n=1 Tax=Desulfovibrio intestinalis TaxID=58621 RepID=A0A7W8BZU5_9BACT|nr:hypothetical protein [Desulfovibrio intestinalis]
MPEFVDVFIIIALDFTVFLGRNDRLHISLYSHFDYFVCVISSISQKCFCVQSVNQSTGFLAISSGTFCNNNSDRHTMRIHGQVYLGVEPPFVRLMA